MSECYRPPCRGTPHKSAGLRTATPGDGQPERTHSLPDPGLPGPFVLPDLSQNISGNLDVSVRESDGTTHNWQVNTASVPFMARKGQLRYKVAAGRPLYGGLHNNRAVSPDFMLGEATGGV